MACRKPPSRSQYCCRARARPRKRCSRSRSRRRRCGKRKKSCRPGKITRNPFFNYLRWFRKKHCGMNMVQVAVEGAKCWCKMSDGQRKKFYREACGAPKMRRRRRCGRSRRRRRRSRRRRSRCGGRSRRRRRRSRSRSRSRSCMSACSRPRRARSACG